LLTASVIFCQKISIKNNALIHILMRRMMH
jgi:hypothetical protein